MGDRGYTVLLVDDVEECQLAVRHALRDLDAQLVVAGTLAEARSRLAERTPDLVLLDLGLPDGDGLKLRSELRPETPVFLLTGNDTVEEKVRAFGQGVDDYLTKPVNPAELRARVEARLKRRSEISSLSAGDLSVNLHSMKAFRREGDRSIELDLTSKELRILSLLLRNRGRIFSRPEIVKEVWGDEVHVLDRTVDSHIAGLRKKLKPHSDAIESVPNEGYRFRS